MLPASERSARSQLSGRLSSTRCCASRTRLSSAKALSEQCGTARWRLLAAENVSQIDGKAAQSVSLFQLLSGGDSACNLDVGSFSAEPVQRRGSAFRARDQHLSRDGTALVGSFRADVRSRYQALAGGSDAGFQAVALAPQ
jgi:hypothetical protein